jgi:hypothetical protein
MASLRTKLERLESLREKFGALVASEKLHLLTELEHKSLGRAADVIRVKGGVHEIDYVKLFDAHKRLRRAVAAFAANAAANE